MSEHNAGMSNRPCSTASLSRDADTVRLRYSKTETFLPPERLQAYARLVRRALPDAEVLALLDPSRRVCWTSRSWQLDDRLVDRMRSLPDVCQRVQWVDPLRLFVAVPLRLGVGSLGALVVSCGASRSGGLSVSAELVENRLRPILDRLVTETAKVKGGAACDADVVGRSERTEQIEEPLSIHEDRQRTALGAQIKELLEVTVEQMAVAFAAVYIPERQIDITWSAHDSSAMNFEDVYRRNQAHLMRFMVHRAEPLAITREQGTNIAGPHKLLSIPVTCPGERPIGMITFFGPPVWVGTDQRRMALACYVAREIARAGQSHRDATTGLLTVFAMEEEIQSVLGAHPAGNRHTVVCIDVDEFQSINKRFGSKTADGIIAEVAAALRSPYLPRGTVACRQKDDKFVLFMPDTGRADAIQCLRLLQAEIALISGGSKSVRMGVSVTCGIAVLSQLPVVESFSYALMAAQLACCAAKNRGRGGIECFSGIDDNMVFRRQDVMKAVQLRAALRQKGLSPAETSARMCSTRKGTVNEGLVTGYGEDK